MKTSIYDKKQSLFPASADALQMQHNAYNHLRPSATNDLSENQACSSRYMPPALQLNSNEVFTGEDTHAHNMFTDGSGGVKFDAETIENEFLYARFKGAGNITLKAALLKLYELQSIGDGTQLPVNHPVMMAIHRLSELRGLSFESAKTQYIKALELRQKAEEALAKKGQGAVDNVNIHQHPDFAGSTAQLRFGKIVGDVFGLDPAIATILSPTGGILGPGNSSPNFHYSFNPHGAVSIHGALHDAGGFLYKAFGIGPGYDYLGKEIGSNPGNPMTGQSNIEAMQDMMSRQGLSNGEGSEQLMEQSARAVSNTYRTYQYGLTGDNNIRETIKNLTPEQAKSMKIGSLAVKFSRLLSGWISDADVKAVETLAALISDQQRGLIYNNWFLKEGPTIWNISHRTRVRVALSR